MFWPWDGAASRPPREAWEISGRPGFLLTGICCWLSRIPGLFREPWGKGTPKSARGPASLLGSWGLRPSLRNPHPHPVLLECSVRNLHRGQGAGWGHRLGAGPFRPAGCVGSRAGRPQGLPAKETTWGHCSLGGPPTPKPQSCLRPTGPPPSRPAAGAPSSPLRPPGPWHGGSLLPTTTSGSR